MFAKIFSQIYDSSIVENPAVRFTFMDLLVMADRNGVVDMTHEAIARRTNRSIETIRKTILELEGPDPRSRTPDLNGARIKRLDQHRDWGWLIINYKEFREIASEEQRREKTLARVHKHRQTKALQHVTHCNAGNAMQRQREKQKNKETEIEIPLSLFALGKPFEDTWADFIADRKERGKKITSRAAKMILTRLEEKPQRAIEALRKAIEKGWTSFEWDWLDRGNNGKHATPVAGKVPERWAEFLKHKGVAYEYKHAPEYLRIEFATWRRTNSKPVTK